MSGLHLTKTEQRIYDALVAADGKFLPTSDIAMIALGTDFEAHTLVRAHICNMRKKLPDGAIESNRTRGYRWTPGSVAPARPVVEKSCACGCGAAVRRTYAPGHGPYQQRKPLVTRERMREAQRARFAREKQQREAVA
jgi:hypothetical protein